MIHEMATRKYRQKRRAEKQRETRARIVAATMALHEELGPARTTISAIAERAGVERLTVYRHFPDDRALFHACSSRFLEGNPPPDPESFRDAPSAEERVRKTLLAYYRYYRATKGMWRSVYRDVELVPANAEVVAEFDGYLKGIRDVLTKVLAGSTAERRALRPVLGHALRFATWESLDEEGLSDAAKAASILGWLRAVGEDLEARTASRR